MRSRRWASPVTTARRPRARSPLPRISSTRALKPLRSANGITRRCRRLRRAARFSTGPAARASTTSTALWLPTRTITARCFGTIIVRRRPGWTRANYHLTTDLANRAIDNFTSHASIYPDRPFFLFWAPSAMHSPHQVEQKYIDMYKGKFDMGWDKAREAIFAKQMAMKLLPAGTKLSNGIPEIPKWDSLNAEQKKLYARQMEVFAGMMTQTDEQIGRMIATLKRTGQYDNTLIMLTSDNGASGEGGLNGLYNESLVINGMQATFEENMKHYDEWGGPNTYPHYHAGWAMAGNTPFKYCKQIVHNGGVADPLIITWPKGIKAKGEIRNQYSFITDIMPTALEATGTPFMEEIDGVKQMPMDGISLAYSFDNGGAPSARTEQYYEQLGNRAMYKDGWKAVTIHGNRMPWVTAGTFPFDKDVWELYNLNEDFSETENLAEKNPEKLEELKKEWDEQAWKNNVYPLYDDVNSRLAKQFSRAFGDRKSFTYYAPGAATHPRSRFCSRSKTLRTPSRPRST